MPTYEYKCPRGHHFERFSQRMTKGPTATCPKCGKRARRLVSGGAGLVFKGSGFYINDYKRAGEKASGERASGEQAGGEKAAESKPPEAKTESKSKKDSGDK